MSEAYNTDPYRDMIDHPDEPGLEWLEHLEWSDTERQDRLLRHWDGRPDPKPPRRHKATTAEWRVIRARMLVGSCQVCKAQAANSLHHLLKRSQGGDDVEANLLPVCGTGTTGCHGLIEGRSRWALGQVRAWVLQHPVTLDYLTRAKSWDWLDRVYPKWEEAA